MKYYKPIKWDEIPDIITKDQFYRICHISKSTALHLLRNGIVPCEYTGKRTRCYKIRKEDVQKYLASKTKFPEYYSAPKGWYKDTHRLTLPADLPEDTFVKMKAYYSNLLKDYRDVIITSEIVKLTGYAKSTINNWCNRRLLKHFRKGIFTYVPKVFLVDFFCSYSFRSIIRKTSWHYQTLNEFQYLMETKGAENNG